MYSVDLLAEAAKWVAITFVTASALLVAHGLYTRGIIRFGILRGEDGALSATRMLTLAATVFVAIWFLVKINTNNVEVGEGKIPDIPDEYLLILLGSNGAYLGAKSVFLGVLNNPIRKLKDIFI